MYDIDVIKKEMILNGKNPDDYEIVITDEYYSISPKWYTLNKEIAKKEDVLIQDDVDLVAETTVFAMADIEVLAETLVYALNEIEVLKSEIEGLKNG